MDVIIEGKITSDEGMGEVLKTCTEIKSVKTPILRVNNGDSDLQGQIAFSQGGYIIGGKISQTGETGYEAIRKLLTIVEGNYAILDPLRKHITDVNQSLWLKVDKVVPLLPNLPENPDGLLDKQPEVVSTSIRKDSQQVDIGAGLTTTLEEPVPPTTVTIRPLAKSRKFNIGAWRILRAGLVIILGFAALLYGFTYSHEIMDFINNLIAHH